MTRFRHWFAALFVLASSAVFGVSCAGTTSKDAEEPLVPASGPAVERRVPDSSEMVGGCPGERADEPRQCTSNEDCCAGFSCSFDPERSHVIKYCLEG
jgi:hypothetical protein